MELKKYKLGEIAHFVEDKVKSSDVDLEQYVTTDSLLQNKQGRTIAVNLPPKLCSLTKYRKGDVLIGNIRPYLKKIWLADIAGGCSQDVLALRANNDKESLYLYALLLQDDFYNFVMKAPKGSKMPRGDKNHILSYPCNNIKNKEKIGSLFSSLDRKIALNRAINRNLEALAKQLYDYWFVQFDFPDENGRPYKSSGGKMVWNEKLKRDIPVGWEVNTIYDIAEVYNGATPSTTDVRNYGGDVVWITPKDLSNQQQKFVYQGERNISKDGYDSCSTHLLPENTILMSSRAPIGLLAIAKAELCTNQGFKNFVPKNANASTYLYYYIQTHIKQIEQLGTGTTFKEVSRDDILKFLILKPCDEILVLWETMIDAVNDKQLEIQKENENLTRQRDELLPLLMNGQVTIEN